MLAALFNFSKAIIRKGIQWFNQKLQRWTQPADRSAVLETVSDLLRPKSELVRRPGDRPAQAAIEPADGQQAPTEARGTGTRSDSQVGPLPTQLGRSSGLLP